jgi:hypothetical protein
MAQSLPVTPVGGGDGDEQNDPHLAAAGGAEEGEHRPGGATGWGDERVALEIPRLPGRRPARSLRS